jgi:hypothetical protein
VILRESIAANSREGKFLFRLRQNKQSATERTERTEKTDDMIKDVEVGRAIDATLPTGPGQRCRKIFALCRELRSIPRLAGADPRDLRHVVQRWHERALPVIRTKDFVETWCDFLQSWRKVKHQVGEGPMAELFRRASAADPPAAAAGYEDVRVRRLASLCVHLQDAAADGPFHLDCRTAGRLLGVDHKTAWRWLTLFQLEGLLEVVSKGSQATHKASRYRWVRGR